MQKKVFYWKDSLSELKNVKSLCTVAMLMALSAVLNMVSTINIGQFIHIGFSWIPMAIIPALFGPVTGAFSAAALDVINYCTRPDGAFFPGFTLGAVLTAIIYGLFLYRKKAGVIRIFAAKGAVTILNNIILNTLWLSILYGQAFKVIFIPRLVKNLITWPIYSLILYFTVMALEKTKALELLRGGHCQKAS
ncbi:MAG: folate family ECF transporter S component [bacterium LCO1.1]|uniref:Folate family ECF transporter S component n=1 Tax=Candidatus Weimeria bifida TaxID=2599074 RepID=A0A6N7J088_9FIRM|nr:folate family ECF transporter S component [Candidatus Weimeria bifida]